MVLNKSFDDWIRRWARQKNDTPEILDRKVYFVGNMMLPIVLLNFVMIPLYLIFRLYMVLWFSAVLLIPLYISFSLFVILKKGINWFLYLTYGSYILCCCYLVIKLGGFPNSLAAWGGAFICLMHAIGVKHKKLLIFNSVI